MKIYTVSELTEALQDLLEEHYTSVWISGEISNFKAHHSGHFYFRLKDENAIIEAAMFRGQNSKLKFRPEEGLAVLCNGDITFYRPQGRCQLVVRQMEPQGVGALQLAFEQLKTKLAAEGLFDEERKQPLPFLPQRIGVITSRSGAVLQDIVQVTSRRYPNRSILLHPVAVQGKGAAESIAQAIDAMNRQGAVDVLIVGRGGGSLEDLWAFNEESVARAIDRSTIPIISAVGHETDFTIADFVADVRAPTPSAAAELVVPQKEDLLAIISQHDRRLQQEMIACLEGHYETVRHYRRRLRDPRRRLEEGLQRIDELSQRLYRGVRNRWQWSDQALRRLQGSLNHLSPLAILERGYCIATPAGSNRPLISAHQIERGQELRLRLAEGQLTTKVLSKS